MGKRISEGDRVVVIENNEVRKGVVTKDYTQFSLPVLMVTFDDGTIGKVDYDDVALEPQPATVPNSEPQPEKEHNRTRKTEITITADEFKMAVAELAAKRAENGFEVGLGIVAVGVDLFNALFTDESDD